MVNNIKNKFEFEFSNSFGIIIDDKVIINASCTQYEIAISEIRNVFLKREKNLRFNILSFFLGLIVLLDCYFLNSKYLIAILLVFLFALFFFLFSILFKEYNYKMFVFIDNDFIVVEVVKEYRYEAKKFISRLQNKMNSHSSLSDIIIP